MRERFLLMMRVMIVSIIVFLLFPFSLLLLSHSLSLFTFCLKYNRHFKFTVPLNPNWVSHICGGTSTHQHLHSISLTFPFRSGNTFFLFFICTFIWFNCIQLDSVWIPFSRNITVKISKHPFSIDTISDRNMYCVLYMKMIWFIQEGGTRRRKKIREWETERKMRMQTNKIVNRDDFKCQTGLRLPIQKRLFHSSFVFVPDFKQKLHYPFSLILSFI